MSSEGLKTKYLNNLEQGGILLLAGISLDQGSGAGPVSIGRYRQRLWGIYVGEKQTT